MKMIFIKNSYKVEGHDKLLQRVKHVSEKLSRIKVLKCYKTQTEYATGFANW